jgi:membrane-associated protein
MTYRKFAFFNITGAVFWIASFLLGGYYFGNIPAVKENFTFVLLIIVIISVLPGFIEYMRQRQRRSSKQS